MNDVLTGHECQYCGESFSSHYYLKKHRRQVHPMPARPPEPCPICGKEISTTCGRGALARHIGSHAPEDERFFAKVRMTSGCWIWVGGRDTNGYGVFTTRTVMRPAHRVAYENIVGPIPDGMELDHLCRVRNCVRPDHLEPVTKEENFRRAMVACAAEGSPCPHCAFVAEVPAALASHIRHKHPRFYRPKTRRINGKNKMVPVATYRGDGVPKATATGENDG